MLARDPVCGMEVEPAIAPAQEHFGGFAVRRLPRTGACSEMVLFPDFNKSAKLPTGETVAVEFMPEEPSEYEVACQMGMFRGKLIVE